MGRTPSDGSGPVRGAGRRGNLHGQQQITPVRLTSSYTYGVESLQTVVGFEEALRADVQPVLWEKRDFLVTNGPAAMANTSPAIEGIISGLTDPTNPSDVFTALSVLDAYETAPLTANMPWTIPKSRC